MPCSGLVWDSIDLKGKRLFVERQATRRREDDGTKTENSLRTIPVPAYLIPELQRWKLACPPTARGLVFPGEPDDDGARGPIDADKLLRNILRRATAHAILDRLALRADSKPPGLRTIRWHMQHVRGSGKSVVLP
jgi:integrase